MVRDTQEYRRALIAKSKLEALSLMDGQRSKCRVDGYQLPPDGLDRLVATAAQRTFKAAGRIEEVAGLVRDAAGQRKDSVSPGGGLR